MKRCLRIEVAPKAGVFFSPETISKGDDMKNKRKVSPFFLSLPVYLPRIAVLSLFFARLHGLEATWKLGEINVK